MAKTTAATGKIPEDSLRRELEEFAEKIKNLLEHPDRYSERKLPWRREIKREWFLEFLRELLDILLKIEKMLGRMPSPTVE